VLSCRIIGIPQIEQKSKAKAERNDRLFAVPRRSHSEQGLRDVRDLSKPIQQELEKFFIATDKLEDKKLEILGWKGPTVATKAIKDSMRHSRTATTNSPQHRRRIIKQRVPSANSPPLSRAGLRRRARTAASSGLRLPMGSEARSRLST
jgi:hypothetical protein